MKKIIILIFILSFNINCFALKGLMNNELKLADEIAKNKKEETNIKGELNANKKEQNIEAEKLEIKEENKTENTGIKAAADIAAELIIGKKESITNTAQEIKNQVGLIGIDIMYILIGLSVLITLILIILTLIIMIVKKNNRNKILTEKYSEKSLLKAAINQIKSKDAASAFICNEIINQYDVFKTMLNLK